MIPGRASVVRDRYGVHLIVGVPKSYDVVLTTIPGAGWDGLIRRWLVPVTGEAELRTALAGLDVAWSVDHRAAQQEPAHRCTVCRHPLAAVLVAQGQTTHWGCRPAAAKPDNRDDLQEALL